MFEKRHFKGQSHENFELQFFHQTSPPTPLIYTLTYFRERWRIRQDIRVSNRRWRLWVMTQGCHWHHWVSENELLYMIAPWLCGVIDTAKSKLSSVNDTTESKFSGIIDTAESTQTLLSQFEKLVKTLISFKRKWNQNSSKNERYYPRPLRQNIKKCGRIRKLFWLICVIDTTESTPNSNMSANSKLNAKTI